jgi:hypothetical protein
LTNLFNLLFKNQHPKRIETLKNTRFSGYKGSNFKKRRCEKMKKKIIEEKKVKVVIPSKEQRAAVLENLLVNDQIHATKCGSPTCCYTSCTRC